MQSVFEIIAFYHPDDMYESDWEGSLGIVASLQEAVASIARAQSATGPMLQVDSDDGHGVLIRERMLGRFTGEVGSDTIATYDWRGVRVESAK